MPKPTRPSKTCSKKVFPEFVRTVRCLYADADDRADVEFWAMDEHRIGLKPILRRTWAKRGQRPVVLVHHRYQWSYVYGFVQPRTGRSFYLLMPTVSIPAFSAALREFASFTGAGQGKHIFLLMDCAGWHTSPQLGLECPASIHRCFLPSYSPELQPAEHLWPLTNRPLANRRFSSLDELEAVQADHCNWLQDHPDLVRSATCFHWWPDSSSQ
jgi:transposase